MFPFIYHEEEYNSCTTMDYNAPWCALTENYDKDGQWDVCSGRYRNRNPTRLVVLMIKR